jgi:hypothetical protein
MSLKMKSAIELVPDNGLSPENKKAENKRQMFNGNQYKLRVESAKQDIGSPTPGRLRIKSPADQDNQ